MAGRIVRDDIEMLRQRGKLVEIAGDYTKMQRSGARWKGRCPFHTEKTPSFTVDPDRNLYHCFGCGVGGDIYDFLMRAEGLDFNEAVEHLARRLGVQVRYEELSAGRQRTLGLVFNGDDRPLAGYSGSYYRTDPVPAAPGSRWCSRITRLWVSRCGARAFARWRWWTPPAAPAWTS